MVVRNGGRSVLGLSRISVVAGAPIRKTMLNRVQSFVYCIAIAAVAAVALLYARPETSDVNLLWGAALFVALGGIATLFRYQFSKQAFGSIAFLPFLVAVTLHPAWSTALLVGFATALGEWTQKKRNLKRVFNTAQYTLAASISVYTFVALGGKSLVVDEQFRLLPLASAVMSFLLVNSLSVAAAVGLSEGRGVFSVWRTNNEKLITFDVLTIPVVYCCALAFTHFGFIGFLVVSINLLGARQFFSANRHLEQTNRELLEVMVANIEAQDPYTSGHSMRVRRIAKIIASAYGLPARQIERIGIAALLHDVGKGDRIFFEILKKPGRLTQEERAIMELHPVKSADIVARVTQLADIVPSVRHHHENFDGTGYPDRLAGNAIPIGSRIIMLADTIDAMTTDRPYRKALGIDVVQAELINYRGTQFDPEICDALLKSPQFYRIFDTQDSGKLQTVTQIFDRIRKPRTPVTV